MDGETKLTWTQMGSVGMNDSPIQHRFGRTATAPSIMQIASVGCAAVDTLLHLARCSPTFRLVRWPEASEASFSEVLGTPEPLCSTQLQRASRRTSVRVSAQCGHNRGGPSSLRSSEVSLIWVVGDTPPGAYTSVKGAATRAQPELVVWYGPCPRLIRYQLRPVPLAFHT